MRSSIGARLSDRNWSKTTQWQWQDRVALSARWNTMAYSICGPIGAMCSVRDGERTHKENARKKYCSLVDTANNEVLTPSDPGLRYDL